MGGGGFFFAQTPNMWSPATKRSVFVAFLLLAVRSKGYLRSNCSINNSITENYSSFFSKVSSFDDERRPYAVNLRCEVKHDRRDDFVSLVRQNQCLTLDTEPAALRYVVGENVAEPNVFHIHEQFVGEAGFLAHRDTPHAAEWADFKRTEPFLYLSFAFYYNDAPTHGNDDDEDDDDGTSRWSSFCSHTELYPKPERWKDLLAAIAESTKNSDGERVRFAYGENRDGPSTLVMHKEYVDEGALRWEGTETWKAFVATEPFIKDPVVDVFTTGL